MARNQCDGCQAGKPIDKNGNHVFDGPVKNLMRCQRDKYVESPSITIGCRCCNEPVVELTTEPKP